MKLLFSFLLLLIPGLGAFCQSGEAKKYTGKPYGGIAWAIPGKIQAENFDEEGEGVSYHENDTLKGNLITKPYRISPVDIEKTKTGIYMVGYIDEAEWQAFTVDVKEQGSYDLEISMTGWKDTTSAVAFLFDGIDKTGAVYPIKTRSWDDFTIILKKGILLKKGRQVMKVISRDLPGTSTLTATCLKNRAVTIHKKVEASHCFYDCKLIYTV